MEPVFAAMFGFLVVGEMLSAQGYAGAALVLTGVLVSEYGARWLQALRRRSRPQAQPQPGPGMLP
ncbi:Permease of the drug/metabolite transporter (DMT) superfamily [Paenibacillus pasadenensis]|uniref:Permease of the drug/metabolite transporter (DMT) superfamily n=2 Tax=Paenibacillus TaxID=44249 RepID=A0A2N5N6P6_9BACL|nr:Permease of the drug/metabolite transporter (DMT) superfamily [Paenibacillus pasadenensis]